MLRERRIELLALAVVLIGITFLFFYSQENSFIKIELFEIENYLEQKIEVSGQVEYSNLGKNILFITLRGNGKISAEKFNPSFEEFLNSRKGKNLTLSGKVVKKSQSAVLRVEKIYAN